MGTRKQPVRESGFSADRMPQEIFAGIGEIIVRWSYIEFQLGVLIREGFNISRATGRALTTGMDIKVLCGVIRTLIAADEWIKDETLRAELAVLVRDVEDKKIDRHDYAHGVFGFTREANGPLVFGRYLLKEKRHRIKPDVVQVTPESLKIIAEEARDLGIRAQDLTVKLKSWKQSVGLHPPR